MSNNVDLYIQELETTKVEIKNAIIAKGVTPSGGLSSYAAAINSIESSTFETETLSVDLSENGTYNYTPTTDGYSSVEVTVDVPEPDLRQLNLSVTENGYYEYDTPDNIDGYSKVNLTVEVAGSGDGGKPKIYNGFRFTGGDMATVDFTQYDWSRVYDTLSFFEGTTHSTSDWSNFESGFNGEFYNCNRMFYGCSSLTSIPQINISKAINTSSMFHSCSSLTSIPSLDCSSSTSMESMFSGCSSLTSIPSLDCSNSTSMKYMFLNCPLLTNVVLSNTSKVANMESMFSGCSKLTNVVLSNTSKVAIMYSMFNNCSNLTSVSQLDTSNATNVSRMFYGCSKLTEAPHLDLSKATNIGELFYGCSKLTEVSLSNTSKVTQTYGLFRDCKMLTAVPQFDTSNVTTMESMFYNCSHLTTIPQFDTSKVKNIGYAFYQCSSLVELPDFNTIKTTNFGRYSYNTWLAYTPNLQKLGAVNCDSVTNINYFFSDNTNTNLTEFGGCINLGAQSSVSNTAGSYFMLQVPNLNYQSVLNVLNGLYDRKTAGYSVATLKLHANHHTLLSDDDIAIATNKGWTIS